MRALSLSHLRLPAACIAASFAGGALLSLVARGATREESPHDSIEQLAKVLVQIENRYVDPVDRDVLLQGAIKGMVRELDPHSEYFPPQEYADFTGETEGKFGGIGVEIDASGDYLTVIAPIAGGPAERAGILSGDEIVAIDGKESRASNFEKTTRQLRGDPGTKVELTIRRPSDAGKLYRVPLVREEIHVPSVESDALDSGIAYLRVLQFQEKTHDELVDAIGQVKAKIGGKIQGVVLDMRHDPGGLVDQAVDVADEFLDKGVIFSMRGQGGKTLEETKASAGGALVSVPVVVLVDEGSASAAELVAGALQDSKRATIVGVPTYGKGSVQTIIELPGGAGLKLTTARYYTPSGRSIQAQGIQPDVLVEASRVVDPKTAPFPKEKDLEHSLPPEGAPLAQGDAGVPLLPPPGPSVKVTTTTTTTTTTTESTADAGPLPMPPKPAGSTASKKPDPTQDFQLRMGLQILQGVLMKKKG